MKRQRVWLTGIALVVALALLEQTGIVNLSYSRLISTTNDNTRAASKGDCYARVDSVQYPATRWLPFVKFGTTVSQVSCRYKTKAGEYIERVSTTTTRLWVVGLESTKKYEARVRELNEKTFKECTNLEK
jgi:hypothetical protein